MAYGNAEIKKIIKIARKSESYKVFLETVQAEIYACEEIVNNSDIDFKTIFDSVLSKENAAFLKRHFCSDELDLEFLLLMLEKTQKSNYVEQLKLLTEFGISIGEFEFEEWYRDYCFDEKIHKNLSLKEVKEVVLYEKYIRNSLDWHSCGDAKSFFLLSDCLSDEEKEKLKNV